MRRHPIPVVAACIIKQHPLLILLHKKDEAQDERGISRNPELLGKWEYPGGMIEGSETPEQALERECREELGIIIQVNRLITARCFLYKDKKPYLVLYYVCHTNYEPAPDGCEYFRPIDLRNIDPKDCLPGTLDVADRIAKRRSDG